MTTVVGGDLALAQTGLAVWRDGDAYLRTIKTSKDDAKAVRWSKICREAAKEVRPRTLFVAEAGYHRVGFGAVSMDLAAVRAVVHLRMYALSVPYVELSPQNVKILATGHGNAKKPHMIAAAREILRLDPANADEADAAWMMAAGLTRFPDGRAWLADRGVVMDTPWQTGITWPTLSWVAPDTEVRHGRRGAGNDGLEAAAG